MTQIVNGLAVTRTRRALLQAVAEGGGRIYYEPAAKAAYDRASGTRVTERLREMVRHGWVRVASEAEALPGESFLLTHYRLTDLGRAALGGHR